MKTLLRASLFTLAAVACVPCAYGRGRASGYCQQGGQTIQVLGYASSAATPVQASYTGSGCNVLVLYSNGGGTTATGPSGIVSTSGTTLTWLGGNVFNANGQWSGLIVDVTISGTPTPFTISSCSTQTICTTTASMGTNTSVAYGMSAATPAAIFSDDAGTAKSNPFAALGTGYWFYYADNGSYANQYSGTAIQTAFTNAALPLIDPSNLPNVVRWNATLGTTFAQQCAAATAAPNTAIVIDTVAPVATGFTASCPIVFYPGGVLQPASGQTFTFGQTPTAGPFQICDTSLGGKCAFVNDQSQTTAYPQWWCGQAVGQGSIDAAPCIAAAINSGVSYIKLLPGQYSIQSCISITTNDWHLEGASRVYTDLSVDVVTLDCTENSMFVNRVSIPNWEITGVRFKESVAFAGWDVYCPANGPTTYACLGVYVHNGWLDPTANAAGFMHGAIEGSVFTDITGDTVGVGWDETTSSQNNQFSNISFGLNGPLIQSTGNVFGDQITNVYTSEIGGHIFNYIDCDGVQIKDVHVYADSGGSGTQGGGSFTGCTNLQYDGLYMQYRSALARGIVLSGTTAQLSNINCLNINNGPCLEIDGTGNDVDVVNMKTTGGTQSSFVAGASAAGSVRFTGGLLGGSAARAIDLSAATVALNVSLYGTDIKNSGASGVRMIEGATTGQFLMMGGTVDPGSNAPTGYIKLTSGGPQIFDGVSFLGTTIARFDNASAAASMRNLHGLCVTAAPALAGDLCTLNTASAINLPNASAFEGNIFPVSDSVSLTFNAAVTGGGSDHAQAYFDGTSFKVH